MKPGEGDRVLRAITEDGAFRVITARTTQTTQGIAAAQNVSGKVAQRLSDLVSGTILVRETMAPTLRVQGILQNRDERTRFVADSFPGGATRGLVQAPGGLPPGGFGRGALLQMTRTLPNGTVHNGLVEVPPDGRISSALMGYMQSSEQVLSMISVGTLLDSGAIRESGGYIVQLLPELSEEMLAIMTERLRDFETMDAFLGDDEMTPERMMQELLYGMPYDLLEESEVRCECQCSSLRVLTGLASLPRSEVEELADAEEALEITCDYCGRGYTLGPDQLRGLLEQS